jgi:hypothetical protein
MLHPSGKRACERGLAASCRADKIKVNHFYQGVNIGDWRKDL